MHAILIAILLTAAPPGDTLFVANGGRLRGTVIEESPQGVSIQLPDGSVRRYELREVVRIEYSDGSVSTPRPAPPPATPPAPEPAPGPQVVVPQVGGSPQVVVVGGGATSSQPTVIVMPCPAPPPPAATPPAAPEPVHPASAGAPPSSPIYVALGLGGLSLSGNIETGAPTSTVFRDQVDLQAEVGFRLTPATAFSLYFDLGVGEPASGPAGSASCAAVQGGCTASTGRLGLLVRHAFTPSAPRTGWIALGTGAEFGSVSAHGHQGQMPTVVSYQGWEVLRVLAGYDWRTSSVLGFGLYGGIGWGKYSKVEDAAGTAVSIANPAYHTLVEAGVRVTLFP